MNNRDRILQGFKLLILGLLTSCMIGFASDQAEEDTQIIEERFIEVLTHMLNYEYEEVFLNAMDLAEDLRDSLRNADSKRTGYTVASMLLLNEIAEESGELANPEYFEVFNRKTRDERVNALMNKLKSDALLAQGKYSNAKNLSDKMDFITDWQIIGPFRNDTNTGMHINYPPELFEPIGKDYIQGSLRKIGWRELPYKPFMGVLDFSQLISPYKESCAYSLTIVENKSDITQTGVFRIGSTGSVACFVNGKHIFRKDIIRNLKVDQDAFPASFVPGLNIVLFKWGNSRSAEFTGCVRLTDKEGSKSESLSVLRIDGKWWDKFKKAKDDINTDAVVEADNIEFRTDFTSEFEKAVSKNASGFDYFVLAYLEKYFELHDLNKFKPKEYLDQALSKTPDNAILEYFNAIWSIDESKSRYERELNYKRKMLLKARESKPQIAAPSVELAEYYVKLGNKFQTEIYLKEAEHLVKTKSALFDLRHRFYELRKWNIGIARLNAEASKLWTDNNADYFTLIYLLENNEQLRQKVSEKLFNEYDAINCYQDYANTLCERGENDKAVLIYRNILAMDPYLSLPRYLMIKNYVGRSMFKEALEQSKSFVEQCPDSASNWHRLGNFHFYLDEIESAEEAWNKALELNPQIAELVEYFKYKNKDKVEYEQKFFADVDALIMQAQKEEFRDDYPVEIIYQHDIYNLEPDGRYKHVVYYAKRITNEEGAENFSEVSPLGLNDGRIYFARIHKNDGRIEQANIEDSWVDFGMLEVGDIIELAAEKTISENSVFGDYYGTRFYFTWEVPVKHAQLTYCLPKSRHFSMYPDRIVEKAEIQTDDEANKIIYNWTFKNHEAFEDEEDMPALNEVADYLEISTYRDWNEFAVWYSNLIKYQLVVTDKIRNKVNELIKGKETELEKIKAIYYFVANKIRYDAEWVFGVHGYKPFTADTILSRQFGDCKDKSILLITMLKVIDIKAYPVMIDLSFRRSKEDVTLAMIGHFNHMISLVEMPDGSEKYLDGTAEFHPFDIIPEYDSNAQVVIIKNNKGIIAKTPATKPENNLQRKEMSIELATDGSAIAHVNMFYNGSWEPYVREDYEQKSKIKPQIEKFYTKIFPQSEVSDIEMFDVYDMNLPAKYSYTVRIKDFAKRNNGELTVKPVLYPTDLMELVRDSLLDRKFDLVLLPPNISEVKLTIKYPENYEITKLVESMKLESEFLDLVYEAETKDNSITLTYKKIYKKSRIKASEFKKYAIMAEKYDEIENAKLILRKKR